MPVGSIDTTLIVIRGNSGSGKTTVAARLRDRYGRGIALVGQDNVRRTILREGDNVGGANVGLIDTIARYALDHGFHVVVEGILDAKRYGQMLRALRHDHLGRSHFYYLDIPLEETLVRHSTRSLAAEFSGDDMRGWYRVRDLLADCREHVIGPDSSVEESVTKVLTDAGLLEYLP